MPDYRSNAHKDKAKEGPVRPDKKIEKVVVGEVVVKKRSLGRKFKDVFVKADLRNVSWYVISDVLIPAAQNMFVDGVTRGVERLAYGERAVRQRNFGPGVGPRFTYSSPVSRPYGRSWLNRPGPPQAALPRARSTTPNFFEREDLILSSKEEADLVLERMNDIIDNYEVASVGDLYELAGIPSPNAHVDNKWGWLSLDDVIVRQIREGWLIDFPPAEPIS